MPSADISDTPASLRHRSSLVLHLLPDSFRLMAPGNLARQGLDLIFNAVRLRRFSRLKSETQAIIGAAGVPLVVRDRQDDGALLATSNLTRSKRRWLGQVALELYFAQLFQTESSILDLRPSRLGIGAERLAVWCPRPLYVHWDPEFLEALRDLYAGFFLDDGERFERGVLHLGLGSAGPALLHHLGDGNQRSVRFSSANLRSTLKAVAVSRSTADPQLHPNFVAFGIYVASLHELLESLDLNVDVRSAFLRIHRES